MINLGKIQLNDVKLWWPVGFGEQNMYKVEVRYFGDSSISTPETTVRHIGVRKAELIQD